MRDDASQRYVRLWILTQLTLLFMVKLLNPNGHNNKFPSNLFVPTDTDGRPASQPASSTAKTRTGTGRCADSLAQRYVEAREETRWSWNEMNWPLVFINVRGSSSLHNNPSYSSSPPLLLLLHLESSSSSSRRRWAAAASTDDKIHTAMHTVHYTLSRLCSPRRLSSESFSRSLSCQSHIYRASCTWPGTYHRHNRVSMMFFTSSSWSCFEWETDL